MANRALLRNGLLVTGSIEVQNAVTASAFSGDGSALTGINTDPFPYTGSAIITGSLEVIGDTTGDKFIIDGVDYNYLNTRIKLGYNNTGISLTSTNEIHFIGNNIGALGIKANTYKPEIRLKSSAVFGFCSANINGAPQVNFNRLNSNTIRVGTGNGWNASGSLLLTNLTASGHVSASTYYGDGSNLTGISSDPFPYTGSAIITGSLVLTGSIKPNGGIKIGLDAGANNNNGGTIAIGNNALSNHSTGYTGIAIGNEASRYASQPNHSVAIGDYAGRSVGVAHYTVYVGRDAGYANTGYGTIGIGMRAARTGTGEYNTSIGWESLYNNTGGYNVAVGLKAGGTWGASTTISNSTLLGPYAGTQINGDNNIALGQSSGYYASGSNNILLGYQAGYNLTGSNQLIIANTGSHALVTGDFANNTFNISGSVSASTYYGDGSNLTGISSDPFPYTGSVDISGSFDLLDGIIHVSDSSTNNYIDIEPNISGAPRLRFFDAGAKDYQLTFASGRFSFNSGVQITGGHFKLTSTDTILSDGNLQLRGTDTYVNFVDAATAFRGAIGFLDGDSNFIYTQGGSTLANGTEQFRIASSGNVGIGVTNPQTNLHVSGAVSASTYYGSNIEINGSGSTLFEVIGSEGQLFSITDSLSGSLFAVSDVSGLPILEVFSDDTIKMGSFNNEALEISGSDINFNNLPTSDPGIPGRLYQTGSDAIGATAGFQVVCISQ